MDENVRTKGQTMMGVICLFCSFFIGILAVGMLASYPDGIWYIGLMMAFSCLLLAYSGVEKIVKAKRQEKINASKTIAMREAVRQVTPLVKSSIQSNATSSVITPAASHESPEQSPATPEILANWTFTASEWKKFQVEEKKIKVGETIFLSLLTTAVVAWLIHDDKGESWTFSILYGFCLAVFIFWLKYKLSRSTFAGTDGKDVQVIIDKEKVFINGKLFYFRNEERWLKKVNVVNKKEVQMLEIIYAWNTRGGDTEDSLFVPVPKGKSGELVEVISRI